MTEDRSGGTNNRRLSVAPCMPVAGTAGERGGSRVPRLVVDGMNVIGTRPDGWWRDRDAAVRRLVSGLRRLVEEDGAALTVVLDGRPVPDLPPGDHGGVEVRYAERSGPDAADDVIVALVRDDPEPAALRVVTADRDLRRRVAALGAGVAAPSDVLARLPEGS